MTSDGIIKMLYGHITNDMHNAAFVQFIGFDAWKHAILQQIAYPVS